jgi:hypothetical protein
MQKKLNLIGKKLPPKLFLHSGTHKTGTTAIQSFASLHRVNLAKRGLIYPGYFPLVKRKQDAHHWFAHALAENENIPLPADSVPLLIKRWLRKAQRKHAEVFVSAEALYRHIVGDGTYSEQRIRYLRLISKALDGFEVCVILVFRRPDNYIRSSYQERVMRSAHSISNFQRFFRRPPKGLEYHLNATLFKETFPIVKCLIYEDLAASPNFFSRFFEVMNIDISGLDGVGVVRKSLSPVETRVKNFANEFLESRKAGKAFVEWMRSPSVADCITQTYGTAEYSLWPSHAAREEFLASRADDLEKLRAEFFPDRDRLFPPLKEGDTAPSVPELSPELKKMVLNYFGRRRE